MSVATGTNGSRSLLAALNLLIAAGCAAEVGGDPELEEVEAVEQPLLGDAVFINQFGISDCKPGEASFGNRVLDAARFVAVSRGFRECIEATVRTKQDLRRYGGVQELGPYSRDSDDPFHTSDASYQADRAHFAATSTADITVSCDQGSPYGHAEIGWWNEDREAPELFYVSSEWRPFATQDNGRSSTHADFFQRARQKAANTFWHEAMHQWSYDHNNSNLNTTMPRIVGSCMETVMYRSASCTQDCGTGRRPVSRFAQATCECVDDPRYDVGVIPEANASCARLDGRAIDDGLFLHMDDEDDAGDVDSSASGWIGYQGVTAYGNTNLHFCRAPGREFARLRTNASGQNYAVARMGASCPPGSNSFYRKWDNEDDGNSNHSRGHLPPHKQHHDDGSFTTIQYCLFSGSGAGTMTAWPRIGMEYGVLGPSNLIGALDSGTIFTDDENDDTSNVLGGSFAGSEVFLTPTAGENTILRFAKVR